MSTDLEERLTAVLYAEAGAAPPAGALLAGVHHRARQRSRRRIAMTTSVAAMAVVIGGIGLATIPGHGKDALRVPEVVAHGDDGPLIAGRAPALTFPLTPTYLPPGTASKPHVSFGQSGLQASYRDAEGVDDDLLGIDLWVSDHDVTFTGDGVTRRTTTYAGLPAVVATMEGAVSLGWQPVSGKWTVVTASNRWAEEKIVRQIADGLVDQPFEATAPFTMEVVPRDSELADWTTDGRLVFVPRGQIKQWRDGPATLGAVQISVRRPAAGLIGRGDPVTVQGHRGWLHREADERQTLVVELSAQTLLVIETPPWEDDDVLRIGEATHYNGGVPPQEG